MGESGDNNNNNTSSSQQINLIKVASEYPPEIVIQQNLIRAQVEFYFSDYNLKRDKRLLEKICKEPQRGYLSVAEVLSLSRVRQLVNSPHALYDALKGSPFVHMICEKEKDKVMKVKKEQDDDEDNKEQQQVQA